MAINLRVPRPPRHQYRPTYCSRACRLGFQLRKKVVTDAENLFIEATITHRHRICASGGMAKKKEHDVV